jgi:WD40 repeat protein
MPVTFRGFVFLLALLTMCPATVAAQQGRSEAQIGPLLPHSIGLGSVAFSPDGLRVLSGGTDHVVKLWDSTNGRLIRNFEGHSSSVSSVAFSPDGRRAISGSVDDTLKLWDLNTGQLLRTFVAHPRSVGQST